MPRDARRLSTVTTSRFAIMPSSSTEKAAQSFVDNLFQRGMVDTGEFASATVGTAQPTGEHKTHKLIQTPEGIRLVRIMFQ